MEVKVKMDNKKVIFILLLLGVAITLIGGTFAYWTWQSSGEQATNVSFTVQKNFNCSGDGGGNITPGDKKLAPASCTNASYTIQRTIKVNASHNDNKTIYLDMWLRVNSIGEPLSQSQNLRYVLTTSSAGCTSGTVVATGNFQGSASGTQIKLFDDKVYTSSTSNDTYYLYIWLDEAETNVNTMSQSFDLSLGGECIDQPLTKPNAPVLDNGMIPVTINNSGTVIAVSEDSTAWYNYDNQRWANAVLVKETGVKTRTQNKVPGTIINENDILAYFVWIPRYSYKIWNTGTTSQTGKEKEITIKFVSASVTENGTTEGQYLTHPAFTFGSENLPGIWVGKFETTGSGTTPTIKGGVSSLRNQNVYTQFQTALKFSGGSVTNNVVNIVGSSYYGLSNTSDSHMAKNSEWGAVAYLSHSKYGINTEVRINNNSGYITGCGASVSNAQSSASCEIAYGSGVAVYPQSTTGNISGVFDMSGGAWEYVMGRQGEFTTDDSTIPSAFYDVANNQKYYKITYSTISACSDGSCLGDALNETMSWYGDYAYFVSSTNPWFKRGGYHSNGAYAGAFYFHRSPGGADGTYSFRVVLVAR